MTEKISLKYVGQRNSPIFVFPLSTLSSLRICRNQSRPYRYWASSKGGFPKIQDRGREIEGGKLRRRKVYYRSFVKTKTCFKFSEVILLRSSGIPRSPLRPTCFLFRRPFCCTSQKKGIFRSSVGQQRKTPHIFLFYLTLPKIQQRVCIFPLYGKKRREKQTRKEGGSHSIFR